MEYNFLLNLKPPFKIFWPILVILVAILSIIILNLECYDTEKYQGIYSDGVINLNVTPDYLDTLINGEYLKINDKQYDYEILSISELQLNEFDYNNYQMVKIKVNKEFINNEVINIVVYKNKEKVINKLKKIV